MVLLGNHDWEYILPEIQLMPLYHVFFLELAKKVIAANPGKALNIELMRRLWRLLIREVYDFVNEAERAAKLEEVRPGWRMFQEVSDGVDLQAKTVTDDEFEEATRALPEPLSRKRGISSESDSGPESSDNQSQGSKKKKTASFADTEGSGIQISEYMKASYLFDLPR